MIRAILAELAFIIVVGVTALFVIQTCSNSIRVMDRTVTDAVQGVTR